MRTLAKLLYVEADEEITDLVDRLRDLSLEDEVTFVVPERARALQSAMSFRLLKRYADSYGKRVNLVSGDPRLQAMSLEAGFTAFPSTEAYDRGTQVHQPGPVASTDGPAVAVAPAAVQTTTPVGSGPRGVATVDRPRQASVVSAPPKKTPVPPGPLSSAPPLRSYRPYLIAAGVLAVLGLLAGFLYLPTATATLVVSGTAVKEDITLRGAVGDANSGDQFATKTVDASESQTLPGVPTGQKSIAAVAATGKVVFSNNDIFPVDFTKQYVSTPDGVRFQTLEEVDNVLPGRSTKPIAAAAVTAGASGNVGAGKITVIEGIHDSSYSVTNPDPTTGGADARTATIIQQSDIDSVKDAYSKDAIPRIQDQLNSKAQGLKLVVVGGQPQVAVTTDHKVGEEVSGFSVTLKVSGNGIAFDDKAVKSLLKSALQRKIPQGTQLTSNLILTYEPIDPNADGHITLNGHASGFYTPVYVETNIRSHMKGMSPSKAHAFLQSLPNVVDARVSQSPYGLPWLPLFTSHISLKIQEVQSPTSS